MVANYHTLASLKIDADTFIFGSSSKIVFHFMMAN